MTRDLFNDLLRSLRDNDLRAAMEAAKLLPPLDDVIVRMASNEVSIMPDKIADEVFSKSSMTREELCSKVKLMCDAAWGIESHVHRIAAGTEQMLEPPRRKKRGAR